MLLRHSFKFDLQDTGLAIAISSLTATITGLVLSVICMDKYEKRGVYSFVGILMTGASYAGLIFIEKDCGMALALVPLFFNQLGFSIFLSNLWPAVRILITALHPDVDHLEDSDGRVGIAIGIVSAAINAGLAFGSLMIGYFLDSSIEETQTYSSFVSL